MRIYDAGRSKESSREHVAKHNFSCLLQSLAYNRIRNTQYLTRMYYTRALNILRGVLILLKWSFNQSDKFDIDFLSQKEKMEYGLIMKYVIEVHHCPD